MIRSRLKISNIQNSKRGPKSNYNFPRMIEGEFLPLLWSPWHKVASDSQAVNSLLPTPEIAITPIFSAAVVASSSSIVREQFRLESSPLLLLCRCERRILSRLLSGFTPSELYGTDCPIRCERFRIIFISSSIPPEVREGPSINDVCKIFGISQPPTPFQHFT